MVQNFFHQQYEGLSLTKKAPLILASFKPMVWDQVVGMCCSTPLAVGDESLHHYYFNKGFLLNQPSLTTVFVAVVGHSICFFSCLGTTCELIMINYCFYQPPPKTTSATTDQLLFLPTTSQNHLSDHRVKIYKWMKYCEILLKGVFLLEATYKDPGTLTN